MPFITFEGVEGSGKSTQLRLAAEKLRAVGVKPLRREGRREGRWVLLDYSEIVVHIQHAEERVFYDLERLWRDCPTIPFDRPGAPAAERGR